MAEIIFDSAVKRLSEVQRGRYKELIALPQESLPAPLSERLGAIKREVAPTIVNQESWARWRMLKVDAFVTWILAGEDAEKVTWTDIKDVPYPKNESPESTRHIEEMEKRYPVRPRAEQEAPPTLWSRIKNWFS